MTVANKGLGKPCKVHYPKRIKECQGNSLTFCKISSNMFLELK